MLLLIIILLSVFLAIALLSAACYGILILTSNWACSFVQVRQPYAQLLAIVVVFLTGITGVSNTVMIFIFNIEHRGVWYTIIFANTNLLWFYAISGYRTWMLVYKSKLQLNLGKFKVDDILLAANGKNSAVSRRRTSRTCLDNFSEDYGRPFGNSSIMSKVFMVYGLLITIVYLTTVLNGYGVPSLFETSFKSYDYVSMVALIIFIGFNVVYAHCKMINFSDSFRFTGEVLTVSCFIVVGSLVYWLELRGVKYNQDDRSDVAFFALIGTSLLILVTIDWNLWKARVWSCPRSPSNLTLDDIMGVTSICNQFEEHLTKEYSLENLNFLKTCQRYHELLRQSDAWSITSVEMAFKIDDTTSLCTSREIPSRKGSMARYIFEQFCARGAPQEINLSREIIRKLRDHFESNDSPFAEEIFDDAIDCIKDLLTNDSLRRFTVDTGDLYARL